MVAAAVLIVGAGGVFTAFYGCDSKETPQLVGRWEMTQSMDGGAIAGVTTLVFEEGGAMRMEVRTSNAGGLRNAGRWSAEGANLTLTFDVCETLDTAGKPTAATCPGSSPVTFTVAGDTLTLVTALPGSDLKATTVFQRK